MEFDKIRIQALHNAEQQAVSEIMSYIHQSQSGLFPAEEVDIVKTLQNFSAHVSTETIKLYHAELQKKLEAQGIKI